MKALVKAKAERGIWMQDIEAPAVGHNDVLIAVNRTAICGTDIHIFKWDDWARATIPVPLTVGHEFGGKIVEIGSDVRGFEVGDRVSAEGHITCGVCRNCRAGRRHLCMSTSGVGINRAGAFAEYLSVPAFNVFKLPDTISDDMAAILDPLGNATHTALSFDLVGEDVLITGAGPIGVMAVAIARYAGARHVVITDINDYRLELARKMGASRALNVTKESLQDTMQDLVGIVRTQKEMEQALEKIQEYWVQAAKVGVPGNREYNPGWHTALDLHMLLTVSEAVARAGIERKESRGAHFREDFPDKDPGHFSGVNSIVSKGPDGEMQIREEAIIPQTADQKQIIEEMQ